MRSTLLVSSFEGSKLLVDRIPPLLVLLLRRRRVKVVVAHPRLSIPLLSSFAGPLQVHRQSRRRRLLCAKGPSSPLTPKAVMILVMVFPRCAFKKVLIIVCLCALFFCRLFFVFFFFLSLETLSLCVCVCMYSLSRALSLESVYIMPRNELEKIHSKFERKTRFF